MVKASPAATFIVTETNLLLEFEIVALNCKRCPTTLQKIALI